MDWAERTTPYAGGQRASVGGLADEALERRLRQYKRQVAKRYRVLDPDAIERVLTQGPYQLSAKLDGELWFLVKRGSEVALCAYNGRVLLDTPLVREAATLVADAPDLIVAGELLAPPSEGRARVHHVATALGEEALEGSLAFAAFDLVEEGGEEQLLTDYPTRLTRLRALFDAGQRVTVVHTEEGDGAQVLRRFREWVLTDRYEGLVVRSERGLTYKVKRALTLDLVVLAYGERITGELRQMREMSLGLLREDGAWQLVGPVGNGFSEEDRAAWYERLSTLEVPSTFRLANREGTLSRFVRPEIVVEVRCSDLLAVDSWDAPIRRMALTYDPEGGWAPIADQPTAVMIHPIFLRERTDKALDEGSVGMAQITSHTPIAEPAEAPVARGDGAGAEVLRRQVFLKETKGKVAVRKVVLLATNRGGDGQWPPYVVFSTDFSPGRKEPLKTGLKSAATVARAEGHVRAWLVDHVKRGWSEVEERRVGTSLLPDPPPAPAKKAPAKKKKASRKKAGPTTEGGA